MSSTPLSPTLSPAGRGRIARNEGRIALGLATAYFILYSALAVLRHESYHSFRFDLGLFDQVFWNSTQGRPFESTMSQALAVPHSLLGDHFSPLLLVLMPFYMAFPHPETLLVLQTFALALGAWPVYLLTRLRLPPGYALAWVAVYFLFVPLAYINLYDFHEIVLSVAPLGFALYFLERGRRGWFLFSLLVTFLVKEEMALIGVGFGLYALLGKRDWKLGLGVLIGSLLAFAAVIQVAIPFFAEGRTYPYIKLRYAEVGGSPGGIVTTLLTDPLRIARAILEPKKIYFAIAIFGPVLGLSAVAGWASVVMLPTLGYLLLSNYEPQFSFTTQYSAPLIPLVIGTSILALARLPESARRSVMAAVVASSLVFSWAFGDLPFSRKFDASYSCGSWFGSHGTPGCPRRAASRPILQSAGTSTTLHSRAFRTQSGSSSTMKRRTTTWRRSMHRWPRSRPLDTRRLPAVMDWRCSINVRKLDTVSRRRR